MSSSITRWTGLIWQYIFDWNWLDVNDWTKTNLTVTNATYWTSIFGYQKQNAVFWATTSATRASLASIQTICFTIIPTANTKNIFQYVTTTSLVAISAGNAITTTGLTNATVYVNWTQTTTIILNQVNTVIITHDSKDATNFNFWVSSYLWQLWNTYFYNYKLSESERSNIFKTSIRQLWNWSDWILNSTVAYYDFNWDANDVIGWNNWVNTLWTFNSSDIFWITRWVNFSANNRHIISQSTITYPSSTIFTYELFIKTSSITNWYLLCNQVANSSIEVPLIISSWKIVFANTTRAVTTNSSITWTIIVNDWTYKHIVWVRNWTNYSIYVNWVLDISATWAAQAMTMWPLTINWRNEINPDNVWVPWIDYLFCRTYSTAKTADEVKELYRLSSIKYLYPFRKKLPLNLRDWLVFWGSWDTSWTTYYDASWAWNNGTFVNSPTLSRTGQHKQYTFSTTKYITIPNTNITSNLTVWAWIKTSTTWTIKMIILNYTQANDPTAKVAWWQFNITSWNFIQFTSWKFTWITFNTDYKPVTWVTNICDWKYHLVVWQWNWTSLLVYVDWRLEATTAWANAPVYTSNVRSNIWTNEYTPWTRIDYFNWIIENPMIWNKALTQTEIQQLYYSTFTS